jgi:hypothetical protein
VRCFKIGGDLRDGGLSVCLAPFSPAFFEMEEFNRAEYSMFVLHLSFPMLTFTSPVEFICRICYCYVVECHSSIVRNGNDLWRSLWIIFCDIVETSACPLMCFAMLGNGLSQCIWYGVNMKSEGA